MPPVLPDWPEGTVCVLATAGDDGPHAIPVSAALRDGEDRVLLGLAPRRGSLARLREHPRVAVTVLARDVAVTAHGTARVLEEAPFEGGVAVVAVDVDRVQDHDRPTFALHGGVPWDWTDEGARERDAQTRAQLRRHRRP
jgi:hypothetical protein